MGYVSDSFKSAVKNIMEGKQEEVVEITVEDLTEAFDQLDETSKAKFIAVAQRHAEYDDMSGNSVKDIEGLAKKQHGAKFASDVAGVGKEKKYWNVGDQLKYDALSKNRVTKAGKVNKQDVKSLKNRIKNRLGEDLDFDAFLEAFDQLDETSKEKFLDVARHRADPYADEYSDKATTRTDGAVKDLAALAAKQHGKTFGAGVANVPAARDRKVANWAHKGAGGWDRLADRKPTRVTKSGMANKTDIQGLKSKLRHEDFNVDELEIVLEAFSLLDEDIQITLLNAVTEDVSNEQPETQVVEDTTDAFQDYIREGIAHLTVGGDSKIAELKAKIAARKNAGKPDWDKDDLSPTVPVSNKRVVTTGTYGKSYNPNDEDSEAVKAAAEAAPKRGRGRPRKNP